MQNSRSHACIEFEAELITYRYQLNVEWKKISPSFRWARWFHDLLDKMAQLKNISFNRTFAHETLNVKVKPYKVLLPAEDGIQCGFAIYTFTLQTTEF